MPSFGGDASASRGVGEEEIVSPFDKCGRVAVSIQTQ